MGSSDSDFGDDSDGMLVGSTLEVPLGSTDDEALGLDEGIILFPLLVK